ncbi:flagellar motor switch protein FliN [Enterovibrio makurazakiensis]|uniref:Flagellar motor switch protein FliN n=1 Tax=Enterovibrio gelatinilyticus TaxID=2899819 RepID=A0ABT5QZV1_9GAMM|nr:flagellar motor switch protein FliN [Enterovibrio sp. ZSDZ42]MDD1793543.1 flagellar motor switch protein FliN [Enterovibrio sp. ZSDZ42]
MTDLNSDLTLDLNDLDLGGLGADTLPTVASSSNDMGFIRNIPVNLTLEVASTELMVGDLMNISIGSVIELDKLSGEPMDVRVNGTLLGHAEVVIVNNKYGLRLVNVVDEKDMLKGLAG